MICSWCLLTLCYSWPLKSRGLLLTYCSSCSVQSGTGTIILHEVVSRASWIHHHPTLYFFWYCSLIFSTELHEPCLESPCLSNFVSNWILLPINTYVLHIPVYSSSHNSHTQYSATSDYSRLNPNLWKSFRKWPLSTLTSSSTMCICLPHCTFASCRSLSLEALNCHNCKHVGNYAPSHIILYALFHGLPVCPDPRGWAWKRREQTRAGR